jgi:hypothetical protein
MVEGERDQVPMPDRLAQMVGGFCVLESRRGSVDGQLFQPIGDGELLGHQGITLRMQRGFRLPLSRYGVWAQFPSSQRLD